MKTSAFICLCLFTASLTSAQPVHLSVIVDESSMTYRLVHPLHKIESTSKQVVYDLVGNVAAKDIISVTGVVDVTTFDSGNSNRDSHALEVIDAISYPEASFTSTAIARTEDSLLVTGKLTFHGVTREVVARVLPQWSPQKLEVLGRIDVSLTAFNIERPSLLMIPVQDDLAITIVAVFDLGHK
jgi:polyisoprenoid-binding protein YceI